MDTWGANSRDNSSSGSFALFVRFRNEPNTTPVLSPHFTWLIWTQPAPLPLMSTQERLKGKQKTSLKNVPYWASCGSCCQGNPSKFLSENTLNCLSQPGFNLVLGKETKTENKQDNMLVKPIGEREENKLQDKASASEEYLSFRSNQGFSISVYCSSSGGTRYFRQMGERIGLLFQLLSWWCYKSSVFRKTIY